MKLSRPKMFLLLNGGIAAVLVAFFSAWIFSKTTTAHLTSPYSSNTISVSYEVNHKLFSRTYLRNNIPFSQKDVEIRYLASDPSISRINSFMGICAEPLAWWLVFLLASGALLLTNNVVFSKGTIFRLNKKFPWISMEEYFPIDDGYHPEESSAHARKFRKTIRQIQN